MLGPSYVGVHLRSSAASVHPAPASTAAARAAFQPPCGPRARTAQRQQEGRAMEKETTLRILNALANGIHPATGEKFGADSPYQHPDTVRALFEAMRAVEGGSAAAPAAGPERRAALPESGSGSRWTTDEEQRLAGAFDAGRTVDELARAHNRSRARSRRAWCGSARWTLRPSRAPCATRPSRRARARARAARGARTGYEKKAPGNPAPFSSGAPDQTMLRCSMPVMMSFSLASLPWSLIISRSSLTESALRSASS